MNLTDELHDLLRAVVAVYDAGDTSQFIVNRTLSSGSSLIYSGGHPPIPISADLASRILFSYKKDRICMTKVRYTDKKLRGDELIR